MIGTFSKYIGGFITGGTVYYVVNKESFNDHVFSVLDVMIVPLAKLAFTTETIKQFEIKLMNIGAFPKVI